MSVFRPLNGEACVAACDARSRTYVYAPSASRRLLRLAAQVGEIHLILGASE